jgi:trans-2-enoyl-CoA reductase
MAISACNMPDATLADGHITLKDRIVTLHAEGAPDATIDADGKLLIEGKAVSVTPGQQGLLMLYYQHVADIHDAGVAMSKVGADMGMKALKDTTAGKSKAEKDQDAEAGGKQLKAMGQKMCQQEAGIKDVQEQLAAQLPAFRPYAKLVTKSNSDCDKD